MSEPIDYDDCNCAKCCLPTIVQERDEAFERGKLAGAEEEREACAKVADDMKGATDDLGDWWTCADTTAKAIRIRARAAAGRKT